jgi:hypothetical protein
VRVQPDLLRDYGFVSSVGRVEWYFGQGAASPPLNWTPPRHTISLDADGQVSCVGQCDHALLAHDATTMLQTVGERLATADELQHTLTGQAGRLTEVDVARKYLLAMRAALERAVTWARTQRLKEEL